MWTEIVWFSIGSIGGLGATAEVYSGSAVAISLNLDLVDSEVAPQEILPAEAHTS
jgi:hypothetical protein